MLKTCVRAQDLRRIIILACMLDDNFRKTDRGKKIWAASCQNQQNGCAPSEDSDQPGHPPRLIWVFAVRMKKVWVLSYPPRADAQADLSLRWTPSLFVGFVMRRLISSCHLVRQVGVTFFYDKFVDFVLRKTTIWRHFNSAQTPQPYKVCLQEFLFEIKLKWKSTLDTPKFENGLDQLIRMDESTRRIKLS